jgi:hypothetical protein
MLAHKRRKDDKATIFAWTVIPLTIAYFGYHINLAIERGWIV